MKSVTKPIVGLLLLILGALFTGCTVTPPQESAIPWSRPADWEGQIPGMGSTPGTGR
jgi:hypothetical protein